MATCIECNATIRNVTLSWCPKCEPRMGPTHLPKPVPCGVVLTPYDCHAIGEAIESVNERLERAVERADSDAANRWQDTYDRLHNLLTRARAAQQGEVVAVRREDTIVEMLAEANAMLDGVWHLLYDVDCATDEEIHAVKLAIETHLAKFDITIEVADAIKSAAIVEVGEQVRVLMEACRKVKNAQDEMDYALSHVEDAMDKVYAARKASAAQPKGDNGDE